MEEVVVHEAGADGGDLGDVVQQAEDFCLDAHLIGILLEDGQEQLHASLVQEDLACGGTLVREVPQGRQGELERDVYMVLHPQPAFDHGEQPLHVGSVRAKLRGLSSRYSGS